ncbi:hypothetical protein GMD88_13025 [Pseudoflavonifractor sp. BIOML-A6]|nr:MULTISPECIES: hypothetical protein [unclassified Pseudoflavonifractor]MTQ97941.1 hypothetical protein [Pseudoflavonifractor sp. BIOML-A16]MTR07259.1 hypothetical protein [Pseudoflavonifractor sp. BIOML-A15]MTR14663.1 hypothetical protein [Pseudoflavonifractor sp. BIOML-A17]MTR22383.1 hypothetical protein [Pseudoflavonifractor sp. BIOML-A19]MTR46568.1 hypothetical protein [Pseudoflavonifractor sp. BIOML-A13]MTR50325.1 hypothetical protein [Pseudoflavonifractor sp. BIOML-A11]MTR74199.1 hypo
MEEDTIRVLGPGQVFFDYGPVSMVVTALGSGGEGDTQLCRSAFPVIDDILRELGPAVPVLRRYPAQVDPDELSGTARVMAEAVLATGDPWLTPMAAVAGSVSDAVADSLQSRGAVKVTANNGGDIALRLAPGQSLGLGVLYDLEKGGVDRVVRLTPEKGVGGVATSGLGGRSLTTGIASGVTVFSARCAQADALATLLADRSIIDSPAVHTCRAGELDPDSDIADLTVVTGVDPLTEEEKAKALSQVMAEAELQYERGGLIACIATVQGRTAVFDPGKILD